jgi:hypothetical protein
MPLLRLTLMHSTMWKIKLFTYLLNNSEKLLAYLLSKFVATINEVHLTPCI